jgi:hypothetical protein
MYAIVLTLRIAHTPRTHDRSFRLPFRPEGHARDTRTNNYNNTIHFVLRSRYILLLYTAIAERDGIIQCLPMCTYLYQCLFATTVGVGGWTRQRVTRRRHRPTLCARVYDKSITRCILCVSVLRSFGRGERECVPRVVAE